VYWRILFNEKIITLFQQQQKQQVGNTLSANNPWLIADNNPWLSAAKDDGDEAVELAATKPAITAAPIVRNTAKPSISTRPSVPKKSLVSTTPIPESVTKKVQQTQHETQDSEDEQTLLSGQRDLIRLAFANDDLVEEEFEREKAEAVSADTPQAKDVTLPGWGSWDGAGIDPEKQKKRRRIIVPPKPGSGIEAADRKDRNLQFVIINEKRDKKFAGKYLTNKVPFPYQTREQYEAMIRNPLGREWNTTAVHQTLNKPRIKTRAGQVIDPPTMTVAAEE
jgi:U3 small nucleolar RNA-associated protein 14